MFVLINSDEKKNVTVSRKSFHPNETLCKGWREEKNKNNAGKSEQFWCFGDSRVNINDAFGKSYTVRNFAVIMKKKWIQRSNAETAFSPD